MAPTVPTELQGGRYTITDKIGLGGMAVVHRAYDHHLGVWRAVKFLLPQFAVRDRVRGRFNAEAHAMARLDHPNIVRVHDVGVQDNVPFMVMELAHGGSLEQWLEMHGAMPPRLAVQVILQVCEGISAAHDEGIVHRDLKPDNVLVDRKGVCKLTDFGIAQIEDRASFTRTGTAMGTIAYMAPEQKKDAKHVSPLADVYGAAATLWALLTGDIPMDLFMAEHQPGLLEEVDEPLHAAMLNALAFDPAQRTPSAKAFADALKAAFPALPPLPSDTPALVTQLKGGNPTPPVPQPRATNRSVPSGSSSPPPIGAVDRAMKPLPYYGRQKPKTTPTLTPNPAELERLYGNDRVARARERLEILEKRATPTPARRQQSTLVRAGGIDTQPEPLRTIEPPRPRLDTSTDGTVPRLRGPKTVAAKPPPKETLPVQRAALGVLLPVVGVLGIALMALTWGVMGVNGSASEAAEANRALYVAIESETEILDSMAKETRTVPADYLVELRAMADGPERIRMAQAYIRSLHAATANAEDEVVLARLARLDRALASVQSAQNLWKQQSETVLGGLACTIGLSTCP